MTSSKKKLGKEKKSRLKENKKIQKKYERLKDKLLQYEIAVFIRRRIADAEKSLSIGYNKEAYNTQMQNKLADYRNIIMSKGRELEETNHHYKRWQYIIHLSEESGTDDRIHKFRTMFDEQFRRTECHGFCLSMKAACKLISSKAFKSSASILKKKHLNDDIIYDCLQKLRFYPVDIKYILRFLRTNGDIN